MVVDNLTQAPFPMAAWTLMIFLGAIQPWLFYDLGLQVWYHATLCLQHVRQHEGDCLLGGKKG